MTPSAASNKRERECRTAQKHRLIILIWGAFTVMPFHKGCVWAQLRLRWLRKSLTVGTVMGKVWSRVMLHHFGLRDTGSHQDSAGMWQHAKPQWVACALELQIIIISADAKIACLLPLPSSHPFSSQIIMYKWLAFESQTGVTAHWKLETGQVTEQCLDCYLSI